VVKHVTAAAANRSFSKLLGRVGKGEAFIITSHGRPVARLVPTEPIDGQSERDRAMHAFFASLRSRPVQNLPRVTRDEIYDYLDE
jgi:prevent-host-death family protein